MTIFSLKKNKNSPLLIIAMMKRYCRDQKETKKKKITKIMKFVAIIAIDFTFYRSTFIGSLN